MAVSIEVRGSDLVVEMTGADVVWCLKRRVSVPASAVVDVHVEPEPLRLRLGLRAPGTGLPGVIAAGTFYSSKHGKSFVDYRRGPAVALSLEGARYDRIVVKVPDPASTADRLRKDLGLDAA